MKTTSDFIAEMMMDPENGQEFTQEYLKAKFLSLAVRALYNVRRNAGLTQAQVAEHLKTKQAAIARLEADTEGSMTLHRYVDFALACGVVPLDITLAPVESVRDFVIDNPAVLPTQELYQVWIKQISAPPHVLQPDTPKSLTVQSVVSAIPPTNITISAHEGKQAVRFVEQYLKDSGQSQNMALQLPNGNVGNMSFGLSPSISNQPEANQTFSSVNQEKAIAA